MNQSVARSRGLDALLWFVLVLGTFAALIALASAAFASAPPLQVLVTSSTADGLAGKEREVRESVVAAQVPEDASDVRVLWRPSTGEFAGAWHGGFDPAAYADCPVVPSPARPEYASQLIRVGEAPFDAFECDAFVVARIANTTYAWSR